MLGKNCKRTETSFFQDTDYLSEAGTKLTALQGLCNIGEWHSHHRIDMPKPSAGDETTVWKHIYTLNSGRFMLFIATIVGPSDNSRVNLDCFMFSFKTKTMSKGTFKTLHGASPLRQQFNDRSFQPGPETSVSWVDFIEAPKKDQMCNDNAFGEKNYFSPPEQVNWSGIVDLQANKRYQDKTMTNKGEDFSKSPQTIDARDVRKKDEQRKKSESFGHRKTRSESDLNEHWDEEETDRTRLIRKPKTSYGTTHHQREKSRGDWEAITKQPESTSSQRMENVVTPTQSIEKSGKTSKFSWCGLCMCNKPDEYEQTSLT